jgi:serine protease inhibitor
MLPRQDDQLEGMLAKLNPQNWKQWTEAVALREGYLELPRFKFEGDYDLNSTLSSLGMPKMFEVGKEFSRIADPKKALLGVSGVRQKTFIEVNEEGSEAAAVTAILMRTTSINPNQPLPFEFIANHPFFFAISDTSSRSLLFMGVVNEP